MKPKLSAIFLLIAIMLPMLAGCSIFSESDMTDGSTADEQFTIPYIDNYYVNKHTPVCVAGEMEIYKCDSADSQIILLGGHYYRGGFSFSSRIGEYGEVELPLDGLYKNVSFVLGGNFALIDRSQVGKSYTAYGQESTQEAAIQFIVDGRVIDEIRISAYDAGRRFTYSVEGAESFTFRIVNESGGYGSIEAIPVVELTVWEGDAEVTGHTVAAPGDDAVQLVRNVKPYLIPTSSDSDYFPKGKDEEERKSVVIGGVDYENAILTSVSAGFLDDVGEEIYFNLEGVYTHLTFTAGAADRSALGDDIAILSVYADGDKLYEGVFNAGELQRRVELDVSGCRSLCFAWSGNESSGGTWGIGDIYVAANAQAFSRIEYSAGEIPDSAVKLVSDIGVFSFSSAVTEAVFDGSKKDKSFLMGGRSYNEGVILLAENTLINAKPASAAFVLGGNYATVSFVAGHIPNGGVFRDEQLEIYADGALLATFDIEYGDLPKKYTVDVSGCNYLEFVSGKLTNYSDYRPAVGIAELAAYPDKSYEDLFAPPEISELPHSCDLIDVFGFCEVHIPESDRLIGIESAEGYYDGKGNKDSFKIGEKTFEKGIILRTSVNHKPDMNKLIGNGYVGTDITEKRLSVVDISDDGASHESAFAMANISGGGYTSVSFTVAFHSKNTASGAENASNLIIAADEKCLAELLLTSEMNPQRLTLAIEDCERLAFWLDCSNKNGSSHYYAIYDITLNK